MVGCIPEVLTLLLTSINVCTRGGGRGKLDFCFSLLYGMPAPSSERQHPEAWPARTFESFPVKKELLTGTVLVNKKILTVTVTVNNLFLNSR